LRLGCGFGEGGRGVALGLFHYGVCLAGSLGDVLIGFYFGLGEEVFLLLGGLLSLDFLGQGIHEGLREMDFAHTEGDELEVTGVEFVGKDRGDLFDDVFALGGGDFLPAIFGRDDRDEGPGILADDAVLNCLDGSAAPIGVKLAGLFLFNLVLDDDVEVDLLAFVALDLDGIVSLALPSSADWTIW